MVVCVWCGVVCGLWCVECVECVECGSVECAECGSVGVGVGSDVTL